MKTKLSSKQLEIITEETPKKQIITQDMVDIAEIKFISRSIMLINELDEEFQDFPVKNQPPYERHENLFKLME